MGMGLAPTWLRQVSPAPLLQKTTLTSGYLYIRWAGKRQFAFAGLGFKTINPS